MRIEARARSSAQPADVFAVLADHERWPEWFPSLQTVTVTGPEAGVGARRRVQLPRTTIDEEFIVWDPGARWSFTGTASRPHFTKSLVEDCILQPLDSGGTAISYTMYLDPPPAWRHIVKVLARRLRANSNTAMANLALRAGGPLHTDTGGTT
jgi:carbon monoxide dehydrogenase subunit G